MKKKKKHVFRKRFRFSFWICYVLAIAQVDSCYPSVSQGIINLLVPSAFPMGQLYRLNQSGQLQESSSEKEH